MLRILLIVEFLIAIQTVFAFWSQVGGQYHLDLMFWPWKFGLSLAAALLITMITAAFVRRQRPWALGVLLLVTIAIAGYVTYYYHLHEPADEDDTGDQQTTITRLNENRVALWGRGFCPAAGLPPGVVRDRTTRAGRRRRFGP